MLADYRQKLGSTVLTGFVQAHKIPFFDNI